MHMNGRLELENSAPKGKGGRGGRKLESSWPPISEALLLKRDLSHLYGLDGILDLKQPAFRAEGVDTAIILAPCQKHRGQFALSVARELSELLA